MKKDHFEDELGEAAIEYRKFIPVLRQKLLYWAIRWSIGLVAVAAVTYLFPGFDWLWYLAIGFAGASLILMISMHLLLKRKLSNLDKSVEKARKFVKEYDENIE